MKQQRRGNIFDTTMSTVPGTNWFDLSHEFKFSGNMGVLIPMLVQEVLPKDNITISTQQMIRFQALIAPVMHRMDVKMEYFFVPNRLVWSNWEDFITGGEDGSASPELPYFTLDNSIINGTIGDYCGLVPVATDDNPVKINAMPMAAINLIYNEYYRDQNLQAKLDDTLADGLNVSALATAASQPYPCAWEHDYFTSALPFAQKGAQVTLPLGDRAPIGFDPSAAADETQVFLPNGAPLPLAAFTALITAGASNDNNIEVYDGDDNQKVVIDNHEVLYANLAAATSSSLNALRRAEALQSFLESLARGGSRYTEVIRSMFGVNSSDARLQRPELLGAVSDVVAISEVLQTSSSDSVTPQANLAGHGISVGRGTVKYSSEEHGFIIGFIRVVPKTNYQQGINKMWSRFNKLDYYWYQFAHLGEQEIKLRELYCTGTDRDDEVFGYIPRYAEYRYAPSRVAGDFKSSLAFWHLGRIFGSEPALNSAFIGCNPRRDIFAVEDTDVPTLLFHLWHQIDAYRPIPKWAIPSL